MFRSLRSGKNRGFSLIVVAVLALGIGANTALFTIVDNVLLRPFAFRGLDRLVEVTGVTAKGKETGNAPVELDFLAAHVRSLQQVAMWRWQNPVLTGVDETDSIFALEVSDSLFDSLGVAPARGRTLAARDFSTS